MPLVQLKPATYNPRKITDKSKAFLGKSIDTFGMLVPIVWNERTGNIVGGHQRYDHLLESGETEADVVVVNFGDHDEVALNIALNHHGLRGKFTKQASQMLADAAVEFGNEFEELGLGSLGNDLEKLFREKKEALEREKSDNQGQVSTQPEKMPETLIACPRCHSKWKMANNEVVTNASN